MLIYIIIERRGKIRKNNARNREKERKKEKEQRRGINVRRKWSPKTGVLSRPGRGLGVIVTDNIEHGGSSSRNFLPFDLLVLGSSWSHSLRRIAGARARKRGLKEDSWGGRRVGRELLTGSRDGKTGTPISGCAPSSSWCPSCSTVGCCGWACHSSWRAGSSACPRAAPPAPSPRSWRLPCRDLANVCKSRGRPDSAVVPSKIATGGCGYHRCASCRHPRCLHSRPDRKRNPRPRLQARNKQTQGMKEENYFFIVFQSHQDIFDSRCLWIALNDVRIKPKEKRTYHLRSLQCRGIPWGCPSLAYFR